MAIIQTERNRVHAHAIGDDDVFVRISLLGYDETGAWVARHLRYEPIVPVRRTCPLTFATISDCDNHSGRHPRPSTPHQAD